jgi:peroxiredoxin
MKKPMLGGVILCLLFASCSGIPYGTTIGNAAPPFALQDNNGKMRTLDEFKGTPIILNFWASWCPPCREEMPAFQSLYEESNGKLMVIGVNLQEDKNAIDEFQQELGITFPLLLDPDEKVKKAYNVITQPVTYFINENGIIVDKKLGPLTREEIRQKVASLMQQAIDELQSNQNNDYNEKIKTLPDGTKYIVHPDELISGGPPKDGIPSIDEPKFVSVQEAGAWLGDEELVIGLSRNGVTKAYPFQILVWHELVNDFFGEEPVLVSYCPLCGTGIAFKRDMNGEAVEFGVSGKLHNSDLVMYDRTSNSYWEQVTGLAIIGPMTGTRLQMIPADVLTWGEWKLAHPDTEVLSKDTGHFRRYGVDPYGEYYTSSRIIFPVENEDSRLHPKEVVYGIEVNGKFKAYPDSALEKGATIADSVGDATVTVEKDEFGKITITKDGESIIPVRAFWFAWAAFHPETELYV